MPYDIIHEGGKVKLVKKGDHSHVYGTHDSEAEAHAQIAAIETSVHKGKPWTHKSIVKSPEDTFVAAVKSASEKRQKRLAEIEKTANERYAKIEHRFHNPRVKGELYPDHRKDTDEVTTWKREEIKKAHDTYQKETQAASAKLNGWDK